MPAPFSEAAMTDPNGSNFRKGLDSTIMTAFARVAMPILVTLIGAGGSFILYQLLGSINEIKDNFKPVWVQIGETNRTVNDIHSSVKATQAAQDVITKQFEGVLADHETRIRVLERPSH